MYNNSKINHHSGAKFPPLLDKENSIQRDFESCNKARTWWNLTEDKGNKEYPENHDAFRALAVFIIKNIVKIRTKGFYGFLRVLMDFWESLLEFSIESAKKSPRNYRFGSAKKSTVWAVEDTKSCRIINIKDKNSCFLKKYITYCMGII